MHDATNLPPAAEPLGSIRPAIVCRLAKFHTDGDISDMADI